MMRAGVSPGRLWAGLILTVLGVLFLLDRLAVIRFSEFLGTWWPSILIVLGGWKLFFGWSRRKTGAFILIVLGLFFQIDKLNLFPWWTSEKLWPLLLIMLGLWLLLRRPWYGRLPAGIGEKEHSGDTVDAFAMFSGLERACTSQQFRGGDATALFGGIELDLRGAALAAGDQRLNLAAVFGGILVRVPETWNVTIEGTPFFGAIKDSRKITSAQPNAGSSLHIHGSAIFGGIEVKT